MTYYIKGGSRYNEANPTVWVALNLNGFTEAKYLDANWKEITYETIIDSQDPFWLMGSATGGAKELEIGLYGDYRIRFKTTGIEYYDGSWKNLLAEGGATTLNELTDVVIDGTPADNELLSWDTGTSKWINQTAAEAGLSASGHNHNLNDLAEKLHASLASVTTSQHHVKTVSGDINLNDLAEKSHDNLDDVSTSDHHVKTVKYTNGEVDTRIGLANHDVLQNPNGNAEEQHLTSAQQGALHAKYTDNEAVTAVLNDNKYVRNYENDVMNGDLTVNNLITAGLVDSVDVSDLKAAFDALSYYTQAEINAMNLCTVAEALQHVEDTGLVLSATKVITSADADLNFIFGRAEIMGWTSGDYVRYTHRDRTSTGNYMLLGGVAGDTYLNAATGATIFFRINNSNKMQMTAAGLTMSVPIAMGANSITLGAGQLVDGVDVSVLNTKHTALREQSAAFPGAPSEGDFHYDEDDDSLYRYNAEAEAWIEVGAGGYFAGDNLGNHIATQALNMNTFKINNVVDPVANQDAATKKFVDDHNWNEADITDLNKYSQATINSYLHIGTSYKGMKTLSLEGYSDWNVGKVENAYTNTGNVNYSAVFGDLPDLTMGALHLHIDQVILGLYDADGDDYVTTMVVVEWTAFNSLSEIVNDGTNIQGPQEYIYNFATKDLGAYKRVFVRFSIASNVVNELDIAFVRVRYWYQ